ncbi:F-box only protein 43-like [Ixodes scapularis]|uniref:F-box only protein 43-like n=1 Tax=Ixodes scapularis TaxID=6945 RepID=UPI001A9FE246|nr:F-box only protein 43-like [Ixodes scapularis]
MVSPTPHARFLDGLHAGAMSLSHTSTPESGYFAFRGQTADYSRIGPPFYLCSDEDSGIVSQDDSLVVPHSSSAAGTPGSSSWRRRVGKSHVDFLSLLQSFEPGLSRKLLSFLSDHDLAVVCCTSREWRQICQSVPEAKRRWQQYVQLKRDAWESSRENLPSKKPLQHRSEEVPHPLAVRNSNSGNGDSDKVPTGAPAYESRFQLYFEEGKRLEEGEWQLPCPKCRYPSRVSSGAACAICKSPNCHYRFCKHCKSPAHESGQRCPQLSVAGSGARGKEPVIGGKQSKHRLRRLLPA